ncbi:MAG: ypeA [Blastococcus sp.]|nr:ypeA [Blastococcus sp.]
MVYLSDVSEGLSARPLRADDAAAVAAVLAASEALDDTGEYPDAADMADWWASWHVDLARDGVAVCDPSGLLVGYATVSASPTFREAFVVDLEGRVRPDHRGRGVGRQLMSWSLARGAELHAERAPGVPGRLVLSVPERMTALESLVRRAGLRPERWYRHMERPLTELPQLRPLAGVELVAFTADRDDEVRRAHNAAFTEHHGSSERDPDTWRSLFTGQRAFRPDLSVLAVEDGVVQGYVLTYVYEADTVATGRRRADLGQIGVLPGARGRGLASAAVAAALRAAADNDCEGASLQVDSDNVTGALRLYEKLGFTTSRTLVSWSLGRPAVA